jgi:signal transduction histidine kinase
VDRNRRNAILSWIFVAALVGLTVALAALQYRSIDEISREEKDRVRRGLASGLQRVAADFDQAVNTSASDFLPNGEGLLPDSVWLDTYHKVRQTTDRERLFKRVVRVVREGSFLTLRELDMNGGTFVTVPSIPAFAPLTDQMFARSQPAYDGADGPPENETPDLIELPWWGGAGENSQPLEWVIFQLDSHYIGSELVPALLSKHLGPEADKSYGFQIVTRAGGFVFPPGGEGTNTETFDEKVELLSPRKGQDGRWILRIHHTAGSLESAVAGARTRNIAITTAILILMLLVIGSLVLFTYRAQRLAEIQMQFVAGVSHEVRTPLTVIRNATYNLSHGVVNVNDPRQLERYLKLILSEAEKLTDIVEQVMRFASAKSGKVISRRETVWVGPVIDEALRMSEAVLARSRCTVELLVDPALAPVSGDPVALRHALQNLIGNAAKYGADGGWIGVFARMKNAMVEIEVADKGPGIPPGEKGAIFDPFYRGRSAIDDQVHGAGLGLTLVKRIVEEQGGTIDVRSAPGKGAAFLISIPAIPPEKIDEFADTADRR